MGYYDTPSPTPRIDSSYFFRLSHSGQAPGPNPRSRLHRSLCSVTLMYPFSIPPSAARMAGTRKHLPLPPCIVLSSQTRLSDKQSTHMCIRSLFSGVPRPTGKNPSVAQARNGRQRGHVHGGRALKSRPITCRQPPPLSVFLVRRLHRRGRQLLAPLPALALDVLVDHRPHGVARRVPRRHGQVRHGGARVAALCGVVWGGGSYQYDGRTHARSTEGDESRTNLAGTWRSTSPAAPAGRCSRPAPRRGPPGCGGRWGCGEKDRWSDATAWTDIPTHIIYQHCRSNPRTR